MKSKLHILCFIICLMCFQNADAQLFKRLKQKAKEKAKNIENKVVDKIDRKVDKTIDDTIEGRNNPNQGKPTVKKDKLSTATGKDFGNISINHSQTYGNVNITEASQMKILKTNTGYTISGNWWSHEADIYDGFYITIKTNKDLINDNSNVHTFKIPEEATLQLGYDPQLPYNKKSDDNFKRAVTDDYQNYDVLKGRISVTELSEKKVQVSFSGNASLRKVIREANSDDFSETFYEASVGGKINGKDPKFTNEETISKTKDTETTSNSDSGFSITPNTNDTATPGTYQFMYEAVTEISVPNQGRSYKMSYLLNPNSDYIGIKADMSEYSEGEMGGESVMVMDKGSVHIFVESAGMKLRMSKGMMGGKMKNPTDQMANYDYTKLQKTGNSKTILGATCYEYAMSDQNNKINFWVAPNVKLSNWFIQGKGVVDGYIMEYSVQSNEGNMTSKTVAIKENINRTINPKEYKKMF
ncbi:hypothetical protein KORDIASMS9_02239 [Kordia sp. SMS9]|uniref:hypothetical protein n=1 Tax=Kordia sp. SMS9 TaxID=2282170 RepID=UPI000E0D39DF|nr:hypothetical protein [Kordia sp. SMS9]AXG70010.1 hypothetical protein KORDIASMS9_02239 [Kordia sp. SMS9]